LTLQQHNVYNQCTHNRTKASVRPGAMAKMLALTVLKTTYGENVSWSPERSEAPKYFAITTVYLNWMK